jgi:murein DD-endopeptidase MepM/ murein hydrolase activator NlpD
VDFVTRKDTWDPATDVPAVRGGLSVALVGDDGVRYYGSHLSAVATGVLAGVRVAAGQLLGYTGQSGNARLTAPHLHFGISHPTAPDDWAVRRGELSPYPYLQAWRAGRMLTPRLAP